MTTGYLGITDPNWFSFLRAQPRVDEVNFWQPHGNRAFRALKRGEPYFFKLRAPHKAIAGFGFFERHEIMPAWLAWDCFGKMNGAPDFETHIEQLCRRRGENPASQRTGDFKIGCILLSAPVFFEEHDWVAPPSDFPRTGVQRGKKYELQMGEGRRVLEECLLRARSGLRYWNVEPSPEIVAEGTERYGAPVTVRPRLGQGLFSLAVRDAYEGACAITHEHSVPVLEAAHVKPFAQGGEHRIDNGILLRRDLHSLFDRGYVTITPEYVFKVGDRLRDEFNNGRTYYGMDGAEIAVPKAESLRPSKALLDWHGREIFKG